MTLGLHNLKPARGSKKSRTRVGRGHGSGIGAYSGRGVKGQLARSGGRGGLKFKGLKNALLGIPKLGGFTSAYPRLEAVNIGDLEKRFENKAVITPSALVEKGLISNVRPGVKLLGQGTLTKTFTVKVTRASASAVAAVKKAGGSIFVTGEYKRKKKEAKS